jgi:ribosomal protein S18 acetylase RimI-like enzyme
VSIRPATAADTAAFRELWEEFHQAPGWVRETWDTVEPYVVQSIADGLLLLAEDGGRPVGFVLGELDDRNPALGVLVDVYVRPEARRRGLAREMIVRAAARLLELGAVRLSVEAGIDDGAAPARALYEGLGLRPHTVNLAGDLAAVASGEAAPDAPRSFGSVHVQTDDTSAVERAVRQFVPRLPGSSQGSTVIGPRNGWVAVYDELADREPDALRRLARELSDRLGAVVLALGVEQAAVVRFVLFERGRVMDEYLSVPEFRGPLPPGDAIALRANPTVVARLTGADPARVREAARTAASPAELPPPKQLIAEIGDALGIEGAERGYTGEDG